MTETISDLPPNLRDRASWLINAGLDDTRRGVSTMTGTEDDLRVIRAAIESEKTGPNRVSRLDILRRRLNKLSDAITAKTVEIIQAKNAGPTKPESPLAKRTRELREGRHNPPAQVVSKEEFKAIAMEIMQPREAVLQEACKALEKLRKIVVKHEESFAAATLGPRLQIGLQCLRAYQVFCIPDQAKKGQGRKSKNQLTRELISPGGFKGWLSSHCQWLKEPTAYKYMTAVRGLALDHTATEKQLAAALKLALRKGPVTIAGLIASALDPVAPPPPEPPKIEQQEFDFLRQSLSHFREETEVLCRLKEKLDAYPDFKRAATARLYSALYELTGTHWTPSDEPDSLAHINPDSITI